MGLSVYAEFNSQGAPTRGPRGENGATGGEGSRKVLWAMEKYPPLAISLTCAIRPPNGLTSPAVASVRNSARRAGVQRGAGQSIVFAFATIPFPDVVVRWRRKSGRRRCPLSPAPTGPEIAPRGPAWGG